MTSPSMPPLPVVVVTGANGLVGSHICAALSDRRAKVRAVVRRPGTAPVLPGVEELVGDFTDPAYAATLVAGADAVITTVHPLGGDAESQREVGGAGTLVIAGAAAEAGVGRLVHLSTAAVYDRGPAIGDVDEGADLAPDDAGDYPVIKRDLDAALAEMDGLTRVLLRPPAILGAGASSVWNTLRPAAIGQSEAERRALPQKTFAWVHVSDLAALGRGRRDGQGGHLRRSGAGARRGFVHAGQRGERTRDPARLLRRGDRGPRCGPGVGGRPRMDRPGRGRPRATVGLAANGRPRACPDRAQGRAAGTPAVGWGLIQRGQVHQDAFSRTQEVPREY